MNINNFYNSSSMNDDTSTMNDYNSTMNDYNSNMNDDTSTINDYNSTVNDDALSTKDETSTINSERTYDSLRASKIKEYIKLLKYKRYLRSTRKGRPMFLTKPNIGSNIGSNINYYSYRRPNNNFHINTRKSRLNRSRFMSRSHNSTRKNLSRFSFR